MPARLRRWGLVGLAAALGVLLLAAGLTVAIVDAQLRSDAATAAVTLSAAERRQLNDAGVFDSVAEDASHFRHMLIMQSLSSGAAVPERAFEIFEGEDGNISMSWGWFQDGYTLTSWGGWQLNLVGILSFTGLALMISAIFGAAARWESRHPLDSN